MSQENVEIVQRAFDAFHSGNTDRAEALATIDPNVVYSPVEDGPSHGLHAIRDQFKRWESSWEELVETAEEFIDAGDRVVVTALYRGRGQGSGVPIEARFYAVYTLRDGRVVRVDEFTDRAEALEAAGLSE
jgi:ketosteroid isomerase-like protein